MNSHSLRSFTGPKAIQSTTAPPDRSIKLPTIPLGYHREARTERGVLEHQSAPRQPCEHRRHREPVQIRHDQRIGFGPYQSQEEPGVVKDCEA